MVRKAEVEGTDLFLGCSPREEANLVCAMLVKRMSDAKAIIRSSSTAYLDAWRERHLEVDFMVSPELETAYAVSASLGIPAARHTDVFADGQVQVVEFDVPRRGGPQRGHRPPAARRRHPRRLQGRRADPGREDGRAARATSGSGRVTGSW